MAEVGYRLGDVIRDHSVNPSSQLHHHLQMTYQMALRVQGDDVRVLPRHPPSSPL